MAASFAARSRAKILQCKSSTYLCQTGISVITSIALSKSSLLQQLSAHAFPARLTAGGLSMTAKHSVVIVEPVRTAIGTFGGKLKDPPAVELGATAINAALQRSGLRPDEIGTVVMGNTVQAGNKMNPARQASIHGGLPVQVPAMTVNRVCGSGAQAIVSAAHEILMGSADAAIAGGMENMDAAPYLISRGRWGHRMGDAVVYDSMLRAGLNDAFADEHSVWHTEDLVTKSQLNRAAQDEWALRSHQRFSAAQAAGKFA